MAFPSPPRRGQRHYQSRHRSSHSRRRHYQSRSQDRNSSTETHFQRDRHSRHHHEYSSRPSRSTRNYIRHRHESPIVRSCPLLLYRDFVNRLNDEILPEEAHGMYKPYLCELKRRFFAAHKDNQRLKDMYHPSHLEAAINKRNVYANTLAKHFFKDLQNGTLVLLTCDPPGNAVRHLKDLNQARCLIAKVDAEKGIHENLLLSCGQDGFFALFVPVKNPDQSIRMLGGIELLNVVITYLWYVHGIHYYGMAELGKDLITEKEENLPEAEIEQRLDSVWQKRLQARDPLHVSLSLCKEKLECLVNRNLCAHFTIVEKERKDGHIKTRYVCKKNSCGKRCKAFEDIITHIHDRHSGVVESYRVQAREEIFSKNYMNDPCAPCSVN